MEQYLDHLRSRAEAAQTFDNEWLLRLTQLALNRDAEAVAVSSALPEQSRTLLALLIGAAQAVRAVVHGAAVTDADVLRQVDDLRSALAQRADPMVHTVQLCSKVMTFGVYEEMVPAEFTAGYPIQTIVYSEIGNLRSEASADGRYRTQLSTRLEILTATGESVWIHEEPEIIDDCRRRRRDFFIAQRVTIPGTLPAGEYVLKVQVEDRLASRLGEGATRFAVSSKLGSAAFP
jgi:hypothetical protein